MKKVTINFLLGFMTILISAQTSSSSTGLKDSEQAKTTILVVYYSASGNTEKMAQAVAQGAQKVTSLIVLVKTPDKVTNDDLKIADAIILGSPTYYGNMSAQMKTFIDDWFLKYKTSLVNKVGAAFATGGDESGGKEHVLYSFVIAMMNAGMIIVGPVEGFLGTVGVAALDPVNETALKKASALGERIAIVTQMLKNGKK
jgi:NAD(P)H dehydrogenase (quinone)